MAEWVKLVLLNEEILRCDTCGRSLSEELVYIIQEEGEEAEVLCEKCWSVVDN